MLQPTIPPVVLHMVHMDPCRQGKIVDIFPEDAVDAETFDACVRRSEGQIAFVSPKQVDPTPTGPLRTIVPEDSPLTHRNFLRVRRDKGPAAPSLPTPRAISADATVLRELQSSVQASLGVAVRDKTRKVLPKSAAPFLVLLRSCSPSLLGPAKQLPQ